MSCRAKPALEPSVKDMRFVISHIRHIHHSRVNSYQPQPGAILEKYHRQTDGVALLTHVRLRQHIRNVFIM